MFLISGQYTNFVQIVSTLASNLFCSQGVCFMCKFNYKRVGDKIMMSWDNILDNFKDNFKTNFKDNFLDNFKDNFMDNFKDNFRAKFKENVKDNLREILKVISEDNFKQN